MKRLILAVLALLAFSVGASGQSYTTVTGTVTDNSSSATVYILGSYSVTLINNSGQQALFGGNASFQQNYSGNSLSSTGTFSIVLPSVTAMTPSGLQWQFHVCANPGQIASVFPLPALPCFNYTSTGTQISGASVDISASLKAVAATIPLPSGSGTATNGVGGTTNPAGVIMGTYLGNSCLTGNTGQCFYTPADTQEDNTCSWSAASTTITCSDGPFLPTDCVGGSGCTGSGTTKSAMGGQTCIADGLSTDYVGQISTNALVTISTYISATQVTISANPANAATFSGVFPQGGCFIYGHLDDAGAVATDAAFAVAGTTCPKLFLAASYYFMQNPHWYTNPVGCTRIGPGGLGVFFGTTTLPAGFEIEGRGTAPTTIFLAPSFPNGDNCTHLPSSGASNPIHTGSCWVIPVMGKWTDFAISGGYQGGSISTMAGGKTLGPYMAVGTLQNFTCWNFGGYTGGSMVGIELTQENNLYQVNNAGCGSIGLAVDTGGSMNVAYRVVVESSSVYSLFINGPGPASFLDSLICYWCFFSYADSQPFGAFPTIDNRGGTLHLIGGRATTYNGNRGSNVNNGGATYKCETTSGCILHADNFSFEAGVGGASNTQSAIVCTVTCINNLSNSYLASQSSGFDIQDVAGSVEHDLGGNTYTPRMSISGTFIGARNSANVQVTAAKLVLSAGWGNTAAVTAATGGNFPIQFTITNSGTGQAATPTITYTFPTPLPVAPYSCTAIDLSGSNPLLNPFTTSALSSTGATFTATGTPTVSDTEVMQIDCVIQ